MKSEAESAPEDGAQHTEPRAEGHKPLPWWTRAWRWVATPERKRKTLPRGSARETDSEARPLVEREGTTPSPTKSSPERNAAQRHPSRDGDALSREAEAERSPEPEPGRRSGRGESSPAPAVPPREDGDGGKTAGARTVAFSEGQEREGGSPTGVQDPAVLLLDEALGEPGTAAERKLARQLVYHEVDGMLARALLADVKRILEGERRTSERDVFLTAARILMRWTPVTGPLHVHRGSLSAVAFIGPTGVGKTTMIARLAAIAAHKEKQRVGLLTTDTHRVAAVEQMKVFSRILDLPLAVVRTRSDMEEALSAFSQHDIVFVDTAGQSPNEHERLHELETLLSADATIRRHLVMSATTRSRDVQTILERFEPIGYDGLVLTKLDESLGYGLLVNAPHWSGRPLVYFGVGQNVPADVEVATKERIVDLVLDLSGRFRASDP